MNRRRQSGIAAVEFAIGGTVFFVIIFGVLEFGRTMFVWNALTEATRRGARIAAVCPVNHSAIPRIAVFNAADGGTDSTIVAGLSTSHIVVEYLDATGTVIADPVANFANIRLVRTRINGYRHNMLIPFFEAVLDAPGFQTTLPRESLGIPREGATAQCFGTAL